MRTAHLALALAAAAAAPFAAAAQADDTDLYCPAAVKLADDPAGDQSLGPLAGRGNGNLDVTAVALGSNAEGGGRVVLTIPSLNRAVDPYAAWYTWRLNYTIGGAQRWVQAKLVSAGTVTFAKGTGSTEEGATTGQYLPGTPGRIAVDLPDVAWGQTPQALSVASYNYLGVMQLGSSITTSSVSDTVAVPGSAELPACDVPPPPPGDDEQGS